MNTMGKSLVTMDLFCLSLSFWCLCEFWLFLVMLLLL